MNHLLTLAIAPCPAPRQSRSDAWKARPCVVRYRQFRDEVAWLLSSDYELPDACCLVFRLPMPTSWSKKKRQRLNGTLHRQKPDADNLCKAFVDSVYRDRNDSAVADIRTIKVWAYQGSISIYQMDKVDYLRLSA